MERYVIDTSELVDDSGLAEAAAEFRANLKILKNLECAAESVAQGDLSSLESIASSTKLEHVSLDLFDQTIEDMANKSLVYILLENNIKRIDAKALMDAISDVVHMHEYLNERMLDQDPALFAKLRDSFVAFERLVAKFSMISGIHNKINTDLMQNLYGKMMNMREVVNFFDLQGQYSRY